MFEHVLVAIDFSPAWPRLKQRLMALQKMGARRVTLAYVMSSRYPAAPQEGHRDHYERRLKQEAAGLSEAGFEVETQLLTGEPGRELVQAAARGQADLLLLGDRGHGKIHQFLIGSTAMDAARLTSLPLWLEPMANGQTDSQEILLLATDGSKAAASAEAWFEKLESSYQRAIAVSACCAIDGGDCELNDARLHLEQMAQRMPGLETRVEQGDPRDVVVSLANALPADLIVVGKRGRNAMKQLLLGGTAEAVCRQVQRPVLLVPVPG